MPKIHADYPIHPPSGSSVPGKEEANPYVFMLPKELRRLLINITDEKELAKIKSALKQWERIYVFPGYPWKSVRALRHIATVLNKLAEINSPTQNLFYYQDDPVPEGLESVLEGLISPHDNYNDRRFDYSRQGERPLRDIDTGKGDFLAPSDGIFDGQTTVAPDGSGEDPWGMEVPFPPTGGDIDLL